MCRVSILVFVIITIITGIVAHNTGTELSNSQERRARIFPLHYWDEEYIRQIHSMINAYRSDMLGGRFVIETNALINTKYRSLKRSADVINSLLSLPKGLHDAGR